MTHLIMPLVADLVSAMSQIAPTHLAQPWDNVGLIAGDPRSRMPRCLLCIDMTGAVVQEAARQRARAIVAYHPPIFRPLKCVVAMPGGPSAALWRAVRAEIAVYSPHTALDAAPEGTGDAIAKLCGATIVGPLSPQPDPAATEYKIAVFVPERHTERVANALFAAGAGRIGLYERCSFRIPGTGTFFGTEGTDPVVGKKGTMESVPEIRLETVCPARTLDSAVRALRAAHPYEEPAFDIYCLAPRATESGIGRLARLPRPQSLGALAAQLARATGSRSPQMVGPPRRRVRSLAILVGSAGRVDQDWPRSLDADVLVTGEIRHHDALAFAQRNWSAIALGHWHSERPVLKPLAAALRHRIPSLDVRISKADADPLAPVRRR